MSENEIRVLTKCAYDDGYNDGMHDASGTNTSALTDILRKIIKNGEAGACAYNKVSNMLYRDYRIQSAELTIIVWDILRRAQAEDLKL